MKLYLIVVLKVKEECEKVGLKLNIQKTKIKLWYIYTMEYYSAIKKNTFESVLMR